MEQEKNYRNYYLICVSFLILIPVVITLLGLVYRIFGRLIALVVMAIAVVAMKKIDLNIAGNFHEFSVMPTSKKAVMFASITLGTVIGITASFQLGLF
ncbi:MAG: hypothetical protein V1836_04125 [Candidatus Aenigmatarchaeota archaeon]